MAYSKINWVDHMVERPKTYTKIDNQDGTITLNDAPGTVYQQGTMITAENMNHMDDGIDDVDDRVEDIETLLTPSLPLNKGGTGATDVATALSNIKVYRGVNGAAGITSYPTTQGIYRLTGTNIFTRATLAGQDLYGTLFIYGEGYTQHVYMPTSGKIMYGNTADGVREPAWYRVHTNIGALSVSNGGTGATDAASARTNLGAFSSSGGTMSGSINFGNNSHDLVWTMNSGGKFHLRPYVSGTKFQITYEPAGGAQAGYFSIDEEGIITTTKPIPIGTGGTGATTKKAARKALGAEILVGTASNVGTSGTTVTFSEGFSGVPVVTANGSIQTNISITNVTANSFKVTSGANGNTVQWQAIYLSN